MFRTGHMAQLEQVVKSAAHIVLGDARAAEQLGTLATGTWSMMTDEIPEEAEVVEWFRKLVVTPYAARAMSRRASRSSGRSSNRAEGVRKDPVHHIKTVAELVALAAAWTGGTDDDDHSIAMPSRH